MHLTAHLHHGSKHAVLDALRLVLLAQPIQERCIRLACLQGGVVILSHKMHRSSCREEKRVPTLSF